MLFNNIVILSYNVLARPPPQVLFCGDAAVNNLLVLSQVSYYMYIYIYNLYIIHNIKVYSFVYIMGCSHKVFELQCVGEREGGREGGREREANIDCVQYNYIIQLGIIYTVV